MLPFCAEGTQRFLTGSKRERESAALPENHSRALNREPRKGHGNSGEMYFERGLAYNVRGGRSGVSVTRGMRGHGRSGAYAPGARARSMRKRRARSKCAFGARSEEPSFPAPLDRNTIWV